jgi:hypothetical protein
MDDLKFDSDFMLDFKKQFSSNFFNVFQLNFSV